MASVLPMSPRRDDIRANELGNFHPDNDNAPRDPRGSIQRVGRALLHIIDSSNISVACRGALQRMGEAGETLDSKFFQEIRGVLEHCASFEWGHLQGLVSYQMIELRTAMVSCVAATMDEAPVVELIALWSVVHESISDALIEKADVLVTQIPTAAQNLPFNVENAEENAKAIGKLLSAALSSSTSLGESIGEDLQQAIQQLRSTGTPIAEHLLHDLKRHLSAIKGVLPELSWQELCSRCSQSIASEWKELGAEAEKLSGQVSDAVEVRVFGSEIGKAIAVQGLHGLDGMLGQSREVIDAALKAVGDGTIVSVGSISACAARLGLPPLLRVEIARDFFQTVGLFFGGLYTSVLTLLAERHIATGLNTFLRGIRGVFDVVTVNVVAIADLASENRDDITICVLLGAIIVVYLSFLWFACSGRYLHRRVDEVRQGHEATTWAALATQQKKKVKTFTLVITACLTIYLPLTRLCMDIIMEEATGRISDSVAHTGTSYTSTNSGGVYGGSGYYTGGNGGTTSTGGTGVYYSFTNSTAIHDSNSTSFSQNISSGSANTNGSNVILSQNLRSLTSIGCPSASDSQPTGVSQLVVTRYRNDSIFWPAILAAAGLLLVTFSIPLPYLLVKAIMENRPTGSLENARITYDLDGEEIPFDDKVYARLVANDPNQLRCPYRSLYNGFERRWSFYKVFQLMVKLALALVIVLTSGDDTRLRGLISCLIYGVVVGVSSYSTPFSDPLNNVMEISGKLTALTTCVGGLLDGRLGSRLKSAAR